MAEDSNIMPGKAGIADRAGGKMGGRNISGFTIAGKILFANCAVVAAGAFSGGWR